MNILLTYSSVTGNTQKVAEAIASALPINVEVYPIHKAPSPENYDLLILGFWVYRAAPDPRMLRYMARIHHKTVAFFGTLAAWPHSPHALKVRENARKNLITNTIAGEFLCQGKLAPKRFAQCMHPSYTNAAHPMTTERKNRLIAAQSHPDAHDFHCAQAFTSYILGNSEHM